MIDYTKLSGIGKKSLAWIDSLYYIATIPKGTTNTRFKIMIEVIIQEYETSALVSRTMPADHAHKLGLSKAFYKVQLLGNFDQIDFEYKA
ncbi:hypothetical protein 2003DhaA_0120 [Vibrio phage ICP1]|uniref:Uncharacterized protein ORF23 n=1 Tax=Vibrio phage ICP1 TaxID=979525 RepID=F1D145_9CAUD|nr:hypothetical protein ViPhICP1_gp023 [Vibrio phage ICP1]ADX88066.1 hypothetical protein TUST1-191_00100 [Vibrio phage ICP1_2006_D]ADX88293.1 hypothetical protein TUST1-182_00100 [Vibrio phage ICP1_2006_C]ADX88520.1 hypothetical protein TUST1-159_00100 [Vibrio phage ICP1_2006_B]ADX88746.1 hypothetical protein TUST1-17_00100 [Vibrio phage ICP1_2006_A]ADX88972.1 hypothetical protein TUST1-15_00100 [Vibrio phage ICP1_2005_A]ADX89204.1 hypothetical protein TUST1-2_00110 [Vibrio phage ICP1_2001_A